MLVVLDTSVLISALIAPGGWTDRLYQAWRVGRFTLVTSSEQLEEFRRVSRYPRLRSYIRPAAAGTMLNEIKLLATVLTKLPKVDRSSDPEDNIILAMAEAGNADYLVTRDKSGLLTLNQHRTARIVTVPRMIEVLEK
jgi:putative PIN family toxin of toxin-antitoxin system